LLPIEGEMGFIALVNLKANGVRVMSEQTLTPDQESALEAILPDLLAQGLVKISEGQSSEAKAESSDARESSESDPVEEWKPKKKKKSRN